MDLFSTITDTLFGLVCHQGPAGMMKINGIPTGLCHRCFGLHVGLCLSWIHTSLHKVPGVYRVNRASAALLISLPALMTLHWLLGFQGYIRPNDTWRLLTGLGAGASLGILSGIYRHSLKFHDVSRSTGPVTISARLAAIIVIGMSFTLIPLPQPVAVIAILSNALYIAYVTRAMLIVRSRTTSFTHGICHHNPSR